MFGAVFGMKSNGNKRISMMRTMFAIAVAIAIVGTATSLRIDNNNNIIVNSTDITNLRSSINSGDRGDSVSTGWFKAKVPIGGPGYYPGVKKDQFSYHHIIPYNQIKSLSSTWTQAEVQAYLNRPHIKAVLIQYKAALLQRTPANQGKAIHSAIAWNPNNLVYGPNAQIRCNDPGAGVDQELLSKQSSGFQTAVNTFINRGRTAQQYGSLPATIAVKFYQRSKCYIA